MKRFFKSVFLMIMVLISAVSARAELKINVNGAHSEPLPFAMPDLFGADKNATALGKDITQVAVADLERSGLFRYIDPKAYIQKITDTNTRPLFPDWQAIKAQALIYGSVRENDGKITVSFRIWDVFAQSEMEAKSFTASAESWRKVAHMLADFIYERLTGEKGYFDTRVVFVSETGDPMKRVKRLAIMDQDGENFMHLTNGKDLVLTPRFSPNMKEVTYFSYQNGKPKVYVMNLATKESRLAGNFPGMTFAPRFAPDGKKLVLSLSKGATSDIYTYNLATKQIIPLTGHQSINTSPSYSPDGKKIAFSSDRSGAQEIYVMNADGTDVERISFGEGNYATPVWSPRGDYIAFTKIRHGQFHIGVIKPDGSGERLITNGFLVESPTWSPNGRLLMFYRQGRSDKNGKGANPKLYTIDITGYNEREVVTPYDASDPAWSPLLH